MADLSAECVKAGSGMGAPVRLNSLLELSGLLPACEGFMFQLQQYLVLKTR